MESSCQEDNDKRRFQLADFRPLRGRRAFCGISTPLRAFFDAELDVIFFPMMLLLWHLSH